MPGMGKPVNGPPNAFNNVQMAPRDRAKAPDPNNITDRQKENLMHKLSGYKEKNNLFVDGKSHNKMGKDEFLKLLTVQLENQDPMDPMKQDKIAAELAQFSQLEQLTNLNSKFDGLSKNKNTETQFYGASFLGKEVVTTGASLKFEGDGTEADILFNLEKPADKVMIRIFDSKNNMVGEMWKENIGRGNQNVTWDGMQLDNSVSIAGEFKTKIMAWDESAEPIPVETKSIGKVESVFFENGETVLLVEGRKVFLRDVDSFHMPGKSGGKAAPDVGTAAQAKLRQMQNFDRSVSGAAENNAATNLPLAQSAQAKVNLNKINANNGRNAYKQQAPTTGITNVYDE